MSLRSIVSSGLFLLGMIPHAAAGLQAPIQDVFCPREGKSFVLYIVPEGASVTKGQLVCSLGPAESLASIQLERVSVRQTEASYQQSKHAREAAEIAVREYEERTFKNQLEKADGDIATAEAELQRNRGRVEWLNQRRLHCTFGLLAQEVHDRREVIRAEFILEKCINRKKILVEFTKPKTILELRAKIEMARVQELFCKLTHEIEKSKENGLRRQSRNVQILASIDGSVRLARPTRLVEEGAEVSEGQLLLRITPDSKGTHAKP
jgi:HlyD family secretion protein